MHFLSLYLYLYVRIITWMCGDWLAMTYCGVQRTVEKSQFCSVIMWSLGLNLRSSGWLTLTDFSLSPPAPVSLVGSCYAFLHVLVFGFILRSLWSSVSSLSCQDYRYVQDHPGYIISSFVSLFQQSENIWKELEKTVSLSIS